MEKGKAIVPLADRLDLENVSSPELVPPTDGVPPDEAKPPSPLGEIKILFEDEVPEEKAAVEMSLVEDEVPEEKATVEIPLAEPKPLKSVLKTPVKEPKNFWERNISPLFSSPEKAEKKAKKKALRVSFGEPQTKLYHKHPEEAEEKRLAMVDVDVPVVIYNNRDYKRWRKLHDGEFIAKFHERAQVLSLDPKMGIQTLHAARVMNVLHILDLEILRSFCMKVFPKYRTQFPRLQDKYGKCQIPKFLEYVDKRLIAHVRETDNQHCFLDKVTLENARVRTESLISFRTHHRQLLER